MNTLDLNWALTAHLEPLDFVLPGLLPGGFGLIVGPGATGKSFFSLDIAISLATGRSVAGGLIPGTEPCKVVYLAAEETNRMMAERLRALVDEDSPTGLLYQNLTLMPTAGEDCTLLLDGKKSPQFEELVKKAKGARLIMVDPIRRMHDSDENSSSDMSRFVLTMEALAKATGAAVVGIHHANRASSGDTSSQNAARGSSALVDGARWQLNLSRMDEKTATKYEISDAERAKYVAVDYAKTNYLPPLARRWLKREDGGRLTLTELPPPATRSRSAAPLRVI